jgi:hypothetical protein
MTSRELNTPEALRWRAATAAGLAADADSRLELELSARRLREVAELSRAAGEVELFEQAIGAAKLADFLREIARVGRRAISSSEASELAGAIGELRKASYRVASEFESRAIEARELELSAERFARAAAALRRRAEELKADASSEFRSTLCDCCGGDPERVAELDELVELVERRAREAAVRATELFVRADRTRRGEVERRWS